MYPRNVGGKISSHSCRFTQQTETSLAIKCKTYRIVINKKKEVSWAVWTAFMGSSLSVATVMMFMMVHKNAKMFKPTTTTTKLKLISCRLDRTSLVKRNNFFFIHYKSLALILIESNYFYLRWERKPRLFLILTNWNITCFDRFLTISVWD